MSALEDSDTGLINPLEGCAKARDKFETFRALRKEGLPTPDTTLLHDPRQVEAAVEAVGGFPVVLKPLASTQGSGVTLVRDAESARTLLRSYLSLGEGAVFQRFLKDAARGDLRIIVAGPRVVGAMHRQSAPGDFRANLHQGGEAAPYDPADSVRDLAFRAARALHLRFAGIDLLATKKGFQILEVNASPGLKGFEACTGIDAAGELVRLAERLHAEH
jgi:ribosomal protein S6--L-glutamate ligase